jgi:hypothetical protein
MLAKNRLFFDTYIDYKHMICVGHTQNGWFKQ